MRRLRVFIAGVCVLGAALSAHGWMVSPGSSRRPTVKYDPWKTISDDPYNTIPSSVSIYNDQLVIQHSWRSDFETWDAAEWKPVSWHYHDGRYLPPAAKKFPRPPEFLGFCFSYQSHANFRDGVPFNSRTMMDPPDAQKCIVRGWKFYIPLWAVAVAFTAYPVFLLHQTIKARRRVEHQCCVRCGYILTGLTERRCPECGKTF